MSKVGILWNESTTDCLPSIRSVLVGALRSYELCLQLMTLNRFKKCWKKKHQFYTDLVDWMPPLHLGTIL